MAWKVRMERFGFRSGSFKSGNRGSRSSGGRRSASKRNGSRSSVLSKGTVNRSRSARRSSQKGAMVYSIYNSRRKRTYVGTTANPERRAAQHANSGKLRRGGKLVMESKRMPRRDAERLEAKKIEGYRRRTGRLPKDNKTSDGQYHPQG